MIGHLKQVSTWRGVFMLLGLLGWTISPELQETIIGAVIAALALMEVIRDEYSPKPVRPAQQASVDVALPPVELVGRSDGSNGVSMYAKNNAGHKSNSGFGDQS